MCFEYEGDAIFRRSKEDRLNSLGDVRCSECKQIIPSGELYRRILLQEYEECRVCGEEIDPRDCDFSCEDDGAHDVGECALYFCCDYCESLRKVIRLVEEAQGCVGIEAEPMLWQLQDSLFNVSDEKVHKYAAKAREMFPDLPEEYIARMCGIELEEMEASDE